MTINELKSVKAALEAIDSHMRMLGYGTDEMWADSENALILLEEEIENAIEAEQEAICRRAA